jgi:hypothetical protein
MGTGESQGSPVLVPARLRVAAGTERRPSGGRPLRLESAASGVRAGPVPAFPSFPEVLR